MRFGWCPGAAREQLGLLGAAENSPPTEQGWQLSTAPGE